MDEIDALSEALWNAAIAGDFEAAIFLQMFAPWALGEKPWPSSVKSQERIP